MEALHRCAWIVVATTLVMASGSIVLAQERYGAHLFGLSYHYQSRTYVDSTGAPRKYQQVNVGGGFEYVVHDGDRHVFTADVGVYRDSKNRANVFGGPTWRLKVTPRLRVGVGVMGLSSSTYPVPIAPLPVLSYRVHHVSMNAIWIPAIGVGESGSIGTFATFYW